MVKYVISTEDSPNLPELVNKFLPDISGFRIVKANGYWKGQRELSAHIEIINSDVIDSQVGELALEIKKQNLQEAVLLEKYQGTFGTV